VARVANAFDVADITLGPGLFVAVTTALTVVAAVVLGSIAIPLLLLAVLVPVAARSWVAGKVRHARGEFADQTPETLQLLASALRTGHSFGGAIGVVAETASGPMRRELRRVVADERLGAPIDVALRGVAKRMASVDFEQVALVSELGRTAGGNSAEVLDTIVDTVRERADVRRLAQTLTAQGRLSRMVLTLVPIAVAGFLLITQPDLMTPMFTSTGGQTALVLCALGVVAGSLWIKKIVEIEV
jgi:tight adherence protein B